MAPDIVDRIYREGSVPAGELNGGELAPRPNEYFIMRNGTKSALTTFQKDHASLRLVEKKRAYGIQPRNAEQTFSLDALMNNDIKLVTLSGKSGTGKTLMALAAALERRNNYKQILLARPIIPLSNRDIGYLPGDIKSKLDPYMQPLFDNLSVIKNQFDEDSQDYRRISDMVTNEKLLIMALAYIRGRSLSKVYFIVDEAQNLTPARGQDHHHPRGRGDQDRVHGRSLPDRHALPGLALQRPHVPHRQDEGAGHLRAHDPGEGRALPARGDRLGPAVTAAAYFFFHRSVLYIILIWSRTCSMFCEVRGGESISLMNGS